MENQSKSMDSVIKSLESIKNESASFNSCFSGMIDFIIKNKNDYALLSKISKKNRSLNYLIEKLLSDRAQEVFNIIYNIDNVEIKNKLIYEICFNEDQVSYCSKLTIKERSNIDFFNWYFSDSFPFSYLNMTKEEIEKDVLRIKSESEIAIQEKEKNNNTRKEEYTKTRESVLSKLTEDEKKIVVIRDFID